MDAFAEHGGLSRVAVRTFHDQWITRPGALQLAMDRPRVVSAAGRLQPVAGTDVETVLRTARKITHYGRYGRLSFKGGVNVGEVSESPLVVDLGDNS